MKNLFYPALFLSMLVLGCKEEPIEIPDFSSNITNRTVLIEEITGVRCQNCPLGSSTLVAMQQQYGADKIVVVSVHAAGSFSIPYAQSQHDFRTNKGQELADFVGVLEGFPTASINRRLLPNETSTFLTPHTSWASPVAQDLLQDPNFSLTLENDFNAATRKLDISVTILPDLNLAEEHRLTVLITQDSIVDPQLNGSTLIENYVHRHVLRDIVSAPTGDPIAGPITAYVPIKKTYQVVLPETFDENHCSVVAFIHYGGAGAKEVLQASEKHVIE